MRLYGKQRVLPGRLEDFGKAAAVYFMRQPDQAKEGTLNKLLVEVKGYVDRRNEVAHGIVVKISNIDFFRQYLKNKGRTPPQYAVVPPYHAERWHASDGLPRYAYTSTSLAKLESKMVDLFQRLNDFEHSL